jgi:hypothetical protein
VTPSRVLCLGALAAILSAIVCPRADAVSAPNAYTGEAAEVTLSSVTLKGSLSTGAQPTSYYFQYGTTVAYGSQTPAAPAASSSSAVHVAVPLGGLTPGTAYHYRLLATNPSGAAFGVDRTFTTKRVPLTFNLAVLPNRAVFASPLSVSGTVSGTGAAGASLVLEASPFPYTGAFKAITAPLLANPSGAFSFSLAGLASNTELRVATLSTPPALSRVLLERVAVRVTLHVRRAARAGFARLYGMVTPGQLAAVVHLQWLGPNGSPVTVASSVIASRGGASHTRFSRMVRVRRRGLYRAYVVVSGAQVPGYSPAVRVG